MKRINSEHSIENVYPFEYYSPNRLKNYFSNRKTDPISAKQAHLNLKNNIKFTSYHDEEYYNQAEESLETPDIPRSPLFLFKIVSISFGEISFFCII